MERKNYEDFIIIVGENLALLTPYSTYWHFYEDLDVLLSDLRFCLESEVYKYAQKNEEKKR